MTVAEPRTLDAPDRAAAGAGGSPTFGFTLPLVSVVIVNFNYGRYLEEAVRSVFEQTYPNIECIVLDNASTDDSPQVLAMLAERYSDLTIIRRSSNGGQSVASDEGFAASTGPYVCFLDADDVMLPRFLATHLYVHLSLRVPVGFTCSDMFQSSGEDLVLGTFGAMNRFVRSRAGKAQADILRPVDRSETSLALGALEPVDASAVHLFGPEQEGWPWASMSAFVFRRDALAFVLPNPQLSALVSSFDVYLARGVNSVAGSAIVDRTLTVYRMHRSNVFARHPQLNGVVNFERGGPHDHEQLARRLLVDHVFANLEMRLKKVEVSDHDLRAARVLCDTKPVPMSKNDPRRTHLQEKFIEALPRLRRLLPMATLMLWALKLRLSPWRVLG